MSAIGEVHPIVLSYHVVRRVRERYQWKGDDTAVRRRVIADVLQAIEQGRMAKRMPKSFGLQARPMDIASTNSERCVWTENEDRGYIIVMRRTLQGKRIWVVKTALQTLR